MALGLAHRASPALVATFKAMHISDILAQHRPSFSFEFFPPKTPEAAARLYETISQLEVFSPAFVSVTYGAGGSTRELTHDLVVRIKQHTKLEPVPHLTCVGHSKAEMEDILTRYAAAGVGNILALRGDPPRDQSKGYDHLQDALPYAEDLVRCIQEFGKRGGHADRARGFGIGVAGFPEGHPATPNRLRELDYLKAKIDAGADYICTQLFFDNHAFYDFRERCQRIGIKVPIIAGIMPVANLSSLGRMAELSGGANIPARLLKALDRAGGDAEAMRRVGIHYATEQCADLLNHSVDGIHFYTLNQSSATREIYANLGLSRPA